MYFLSTTKIKSDFPPHALSFFLISYQLSAKEHTSNLHCHSFTNMTIQWCCWKYATRFCGVIIGVRTFDMPLNFRFYQTSLFSQKVYAVWLGTLLYYMKVLSSSSDDFDYVRYEKIFFMFAYVTLPPLIGVILAIVMIYGIINKRSDLMAPGIVYNWTLISVVVLLIILQVILSSDFKNLEYLLIAGELLS